MRVARGTKPKLTAVDLFCGCGGLTEGLRKAGFTVLGGVDVDETAVRTYELNHPAVQTWKTDLRELSTKVVAQRLGIRRGQLDLLAGCPPCQGFSALRTLNGNRSNRDKRNDLLLEFLRFVEGLRPKTVMMENVPGLATNHRFKRFLSQLRQLGYLGEHRILDAADYGVPQRRRRLIYLAGRGRKVPFGNPTRRWKTVRRSISSLRPAGRSGDALHDMPERRTLKVKRIIEGVPKNGGGRTHLPRRRQLDCHKSCDGFKDVYGRMAWDEVAPTITTGCFNPSKGRFLHPTKNRAITIRKAAMLQGFPRRYRFEAEDGKVALALMIGNALPPPFIAAHARSVAQMLLRDE